MAERTWEPGWPCEPGLILSVHRRGAGDPTYAVDVEGSHWRAIRSPAGPVTLRVRREGTRIHASAWGPGTDWALQQLPAMLGADDDPAGFEPRHPLVADLARRLPGWRIGRTPVMLASLVPSIIEQLVSGTEAFGGYRALVHRFGEVAPGPVPLRRPGSTARLWLPPDAAALAAIPSWEWLRMPVTPKRSRTVVGAARREAALERLAQAERTPAGMARVDRALCSLPGVGSWTSAEVRQRVFGDPDAVSFGDYNVAADIGWALIGEPVDDAGLAELLEPWAGHRARVQALIMLGGRHRPRRAPRMQIRTHLPAYA